MSIVTGQTIAAADFVGNPAPYLSIESTVGATHSLTTVANQKVQVIAKGYHVNGGGNTTIELKYNGVTKDSTVVYSGTALAGSFCLMYEEIPGAATHNITVTGATSVVIMVTKLLVG